MFTSLISLPKDMNEVILNPVPSKKKTQQSKNLCSTRDLFAKLFIAILVNCRIRNERPGCGGGKDA
jgi:hypothetical protein